MNEGAHGVGEDAAHGRVAEKRVARETTKRLRYGKDHVGAHEGSGHDGGLRAGLRRGLPTRLA